MTSTSLSPRQKLGAAVTRVTDSGGLAPYFGVMLRGLVRIEMPEAMSQAMQAAGLVPTLAVTDRGVMYWSPTYVATRDVQALAIDLMHEVMHVVLKHFDRTNAMGIPPERRMIANVAQDACINEELREGWPEIAKDKTYFFPETMPAPFKPQPPKLVFEQRYRLLEQEMQKQQQAGGGDGGGAGQEQKGGKGGKDGKKSVGSGACGSCSGNPLPGEPKVPDADARSEAEMDRFRRDTAQAVKDYQQRGASHNQRGTVPNSLAVWADEMLRPPKVDWRTKLAQSVRAAIAYRPGAVDYNWRRPSRRQAGVGYGMGRPVMAGFHAPVPRVAVIVDTSGSMGGDLLVEAASELQGVLAAVGADVTVCAVDAAVHSLVEVSSIAAACASLQGGGGTDMRPGFEALAARRPAPEVVICVTDGYIGDGYPAVEPAGFRTIWCVVGGNTAEVCPWGETIHIEQDAEKAA